MRSKERIERITKKFQYVWERHQDMRFGQLLFCMLENIPEVHKVSHNMMVGLDPFHVEDDKIEEFLDKVIQELQ